MSAAQTLQNEVNTLETRLQTGTDDEGNIASEQQMDIWKMDLASKKEELRLALENQQAHEVRVQEAAAESSSFLGDIDIAGVPVAESGLSELAFKVLDSKVTAKHVAAIEKLSLAMNDQQVQFQQELKAAIERATLAENSIEQYQTANKDLEVANYQLGLEKDELDEKARKGAELLYEATETIEKLNNQIEVYKKAELLAPQPTVTLSTSEQVAKQEAELKASRIKVTKMELSNPDDFNTRDWFVVLALTGEKIAINYLQKGLYTLISESEAEQYRADEANKKAEAELQNAIISTIEPFVEKVNDVVLEEEATTKDESFREEELQTTNSGTNQEDVRDATLEPLVGAEKESEVITLESLKAEVDRIKAHVGLAA